MFDLLQAKAWHALLLKILLEASYLSWALPTTVIDIFRVELRLRMIKVNTNTRYKKKQFSFCIYHDKKN